MLPSVTRLLDPRLNLAIYDLLYQGGELVASGGQGRSIVLTGDMYTLDLPGKSPGRGVRSACLTTKSLWVVGEYGFVARSDDGGNSWEELDAKCGNACLYSVIEDAQGWIWLGGDDGALAVSKDGETFKRVKNKIKGTVRRMTHTPDGEVLLPTARPGGLYVIDQKGKISQTSLESEVYLNKAVFTPHDTLLVTGDRGTLLRSTDRGESFELVDVGHKDAHFETIELFADGRVVIAGSKGLILVSEDDGQSFEQIAHYLTGETLWAAVPCEEGMLLGGDRAVIVGLDIPEKPPRHDSHRFERISFGPDPREQAIREHWRSPVLSDASWSWAPDHEPVEVIRDLYMSPTFRTWLVPRHGGLQTQIRPLPTKAEAWGALQRAVWQASLARREQKGHSPVWGYIASTDRALRALGMKLSSAEPVEFDRADFTELIRQASEQSGSSSMPALMSIVNNDLIVDYMVLCLGLEEAIRIAFATLYELAYSHTGVFERLRELMAQLDDERYTRAQEVVFEAYKAKRHELATTQGYVGRSREGDLRWAATYMLPYSMKGANELELDVHRQAMAYLSKFGDFGTHAAGLASGNLDTFQAYLSANSGLAHQFFFPGPRLYLASILELEGGAACAHIFRDLRPKSPWTDNPQYNQFTCKVQAHIRSDETWGELVRRYHNEETRMWGLTGLEIALGLDPARLFDLLESEGEQELIDRFREQVQYDESAHHSIHLNTTSAVSAAHPYSLDPPAPPYTPTSQTWSFAPEPELRYSDEEREQLLDANLSSDAEFEGTLLRECNDEQYERFVEFYERWKHPVSMELLHVIPHKYHARLIDNGFRLGGWDIQYRLNQLLYKYGMDYFKILLWGIEQEQSEDIRITALTNALPIADARLTPHMLALFAKKKHKVLGANWLRRHPEHAVAGIVGVLGEDADHAEAIRGLLYLERFGHRKLIEQTAKKAGHQDLISAILARDPLTPKLRKKIKLPAYADPANLPDLITIKGGKIASADEIEEVLYRFAFSNEEEPHPELLRAHDIYTRESRAQFVWELFQAWLADGAPAKQQWCLQAVGFWGDDQSAYELAQLAKKWPGEGAAKRAQWALAALANTGLESALIHINLLAEKSKFPAFKQTAARFIDQVAQQRGLEREELADRLAPTLDLDEEDAEVLDFGPRQFTIKFDEALAPFVVDASNKRLKRLPKANASDDPVLAKEAHKRFKSLKKEARASAALHTLRFEMIMASQRAIPAEVFLKFFAKHPWMTHLTQRLVWVTNPGQDVSAQRTFRVSVEQSLVDIEDEDLALDGVDFVSIAHPISLSDEALDAWRTLFADYEIIQPFEQLDREVFSLTDAERQAIEIDPPNIGQETHFRKVLALEKRRWYRYEDICIEGMTRTLGSNTYVTLFVEEGWFPYMEGDDIEPQKIAKLRLDAPDGVSFEAIDAAMISEILRDVVRLTV